VNSLIASHAGPCGSLRSPPTASTPHSTTLFITLQASTPQHEAQMSAHHLCLLLPSGTPSPQDPSSLGKHIMRMDHDLDSHGRPSRSIPPLSSTNPSIIAPYPPYPAAMVAPLNAGDNHWYSHHLARRLRMCVTCISQEYSEHERRVAKASDERSEHRATFYSDVSDTPPTPLPTIPKPAVRSSDTAGTAPPPCSTDRMLVPNGPPQDCSPLHVSPEHMSPIAYTTPSSA
jgi:hypothetical protein